MGINRQCGHRHCGHRQCGHRQWELWQAHLLFLLNFTSVVICFVAKRNYVSIFFLLEDNCFTIMCWFLPYGFPRGSVGKESACNVGNLGLSPGLGRSPGEGHGNPLQCPLLHIKRGFSPESDHAGWHPDLRLLTSRCEK